jgi:hypothetical protein
VPLRFGSKVGSGRVLGRQVPLRFGSWVGLDFGSSGAVKIRVTGRVGSGRVGFRVVRVPLRFGSRVGLGRVGLDYGSLGCR